MARIDLAEHADAPWTAGTLLRGPWFSSLPAPRAPAEFE